MSYHPTKHDQENLEETIIEIENILYQFLGFQLDLFLVGSTAKGTWLLGDADIDIYVCHKTLCKDKVSKLIQEAFPEGHTKQGQLTIWNLSYKGFDVDLILPYKGKREDTILHANWYNRHLTDFRREEIRTAKAYFKTKGVYGAEIGGIIGVAIEQLVILEGSFKGVCMLLIGVRPFIQDPTMQTERDLLACINKRRWIEIQEASEQYLVDPTFEYKPAKWLDFMAKYPTYCTIQFERTHDKATDYQTVLSMLAKTKRILKDREPDVDIDFDVWVGEKILVCYKVRPLELPLQKTRCVDSTINGSKKFLEVHPNAFFAFGQVCAKIDRKIIFPDTYFYSEVVKRITSRGLKHI